MKFVTEETIDQVVEALGSSDEALEHADDQMAETQPHLIQFLVQEELDALNEEERDYLLLLGMTVWEAARMTEGTLPEISAEALGEAEERNYEQLEGSKGATFQDRMDIFFQEYPQEDLLAFVEDALTDDEDQVVTAEGRETMFITLKSVIDALHASC